MSKRKMPQQKPGRSFQAYGTPWEFIRAVEARFGKLDRDLAATKANAKARWFISPEQDSLKANWLDSSRGPRGFPRVLWLNPPFGHIAPWAEKCHWWVTSGPAHNALYGPVEPGSDADKRLLFLTPASVGSNWFRDHVYGKALVLFLCSNEHGSGRITFEGEKDPYPKDAIISVYGEKPGFEMWPWRRPQ